MPPLIFPFCCPAGLTFRPQVGLWGEVSSVALWSELCSGVAAHRRGPSARASQVVSLEPGGGLDETRLWAETPLLSSPGRHPWELLQASPGSEPGSQQHVPLRNQSAGTNSPERPRQREPPNSAGWHLGSCPRSLDA